MMRASILLKPAARLLAMSLLLCAASPQRALAADGGPVVSAVFAGDVMLAGLPGEEISKGRDPFMPFSAVLDSSDIRIANLECVIATVGRAEDKPYTFRAHPRSLKVLKRHLDAVSVANNHTGDFGPLAFAEMLDLLDQSGTLYFGGGRNLSAAHAPLIIERKGLKIALLGYNEFFPRSFEADVDKPGHAWSEDEQVVADIRHARGTLKADLVIPFMHWGFEDEPVAGPHQRLLAHKMIDAGADAVIGGHPHVTQDIEHYLGKPIIYSLGNFIFDGFTRRDNNTGWLLKLELDRDGVRGWRAHVGHIDRRGTPHPAPAGLCWQRGWQKESACNP